MGLRERFLEVFGADVVAKGGAGVTQSRVLSMGVYQDAGRPAVAFDGLQDHRNGMVSLTKSDQVVAWLRRSDWVVPAAHEVSYDPGADAVVVDGRALPARFFAQLAEMAEVGATVRVVKDGPGFGLVAVDYDAAARAADSAREENRRLRREVEDAGAKALEGHAQRVVDLEERVRELEQELVACRTPAAPPNPGIVDPDLAKPWRSA